MANPLSLTSAIDESDGARKQSNRVCHANIDVDGNHEASSTSMNNPIPTLFHRINSQKSILSLLVSNSKIFAGTQGGDLLVWSLETFELLSSLRAHRGSVLCLCLSADKKLLFSSAGDAIVNVGNVVPLQFPFIDFSGLVYK